MRGARSFAILALGFASALAAQAGPRAQDNEEKTTAPEAPDDAACRAELSALGVSFMDLPPIEEGRCGAQRPLRVSVVAGIALAPEPVMVCPMAQALARWARDELIEQAKAALGEPPVTIATGPGYVCKAQGRVRGARLSEHARANAIDVAGVLFAKRPAVNVGREKEGSPEAGFLERARAAACSHFTTVLGPDADAAHAFHFHFDLRARKGGYRTCQ